MFVRCSFSPSSVVARGAGSRRLFDSVQAKPRGRLSRRLSQWVSGKEKPPGAAPALPEPVLGDFVLLLYAEFGTHVFEVPGVGSTPEVSVTLG